MISRSTSRPQPAHRIQQSPTSAAPALKALKALSQSFKSSRTFRWHNAESLHHALSVYLFPTGLHLLDMTAVRRFHNWPDPSIGHWWVYRDRAFECNCIVNLSKEYLCVGELTMAEVCGLTVLPDEKHFSGLVLPGD